MDALTQLGSIEMETSVRLEMSFLYFVVEREVLFLGIKPTSKESSSYSMETTHL